MDFFPAVGMAVAGIFVTIVLSGTLAGLVSYGIMELGARRRVQAAIVRRTVDESFMGNWGTHGDSKQPPSYVDYLRVQAHKGVLLPTLLGLAPTKVFSLPYRQLCGQIAGRVNTEMSERAGPETGPSWMTDILAVAHDFPQDPYFPKGALFPDYPGHRLPTSSALAAVDSLQIDLASGVIGHAHVFSSAIVILVFAVLLIPSANYFGFFEASASLAVRTAGGAMAVTLAALLLLALAFGAMIVATLAFRWIDRVASVR